MMHTQRDPRTQLYGSPLARMRLPGVGKRSVPDMSRRGSDPYEGAEAYRIGSQVNGLLPVWQPTRQPGFWNPLHRKLLSQDEKMVALFFEIRDKLLPPVRQVMFYGRTALEWQNKFIEPKFNTTRFDAAKFWTLVGQAGVVSVYQELARFAHDQSVAIQAFTDTLGKMAVEFRKAVPTPIAEPFRRELPGQDIPVNGSLTWPSFADAQGNALNRVFADLSLQAIKALDLLPRAEAKGGYRGRTMQFIDIVHNPRLFRELQGRIQQGDQQAYMDLEQLTKTWWVAMDKYTTGLVLAIASRT